MGKKIVKISKIVLLIFFVCIGVLVVFSINSKDKSDIELPFVFGFIFLVSAFLAFLCLMTLFFLETKKCLKESKARTIKYLFSEFSVLFVVLLVTDYFIMHNEFNWVLYLITSLIITASHEAFEYVKETQK